MEADQMDVEEVPSHFLCPISLQLMRDPVTISTGITYDRQSIERWLYSSSSKTPTCPVTKQPLLLSTSYHDLDDHHLTPNHTLRRLIQSWCTLNPSSGIERIPTPKPPLDKSQIIKLIRDANVSPRSQSKCLQRLKSIALSGNERNKKSLRGSGAVDFLASVIIAGVSNGNRTADLDQSSTPLSTQDINDEVDEALFVLHQMETSIDIELRKYINQDNAAAADRFIGALIHILRHGHSGSRASAITVLKSIYNVSDPNQLIDSPIELYPQILTLVHDQISVRSTKSGLKLLVELNKWGRNRIKAVQSNAVTILVELLLSTNEKRLCELILNVLDQLCGCAEGRAELLNHGAGLAVVSKKILRVSNTASDRGVRILSSVSKYSATPKILGEMLQVGVVAKLCLVIQVDCGIKAKERAKEILRLHSRDWRSSGCIPPHLLSSFPTN